MLLATDPLSDLPVAFALVDKNDQDHMRRFLKNLRTWGLIPTVVVTDGSNLYPGVLEELWPDADHQRCVFHVIKDINTLILAAVRRLRNAMKRRGKAGRKQRRGRKGAKASPCLGWPDVTPCGARVGFSMSHYITVSSPSGGAGGRGSTIFSAFRTSPASGPPLAIPRRSA